MAAQPNEPSILARAAKILSAAQSSSSRPPWLLGANMRKTPIDLSVSTRSSGTRRAASISAARAAIMGAMRRISASSRLLVWPAAKTLPSLDTSPGPVVSFALLANDRESAEWFLRLIRSLPQHAGRKRPYR